MKNKGIIITLIVLLSIGIVALSLFTYSLIKDNRNISFSFGKLFDNAYKELVVEETYDELTNYYLTLNTGDIIIKPSSDNKVSLKVYAKKDKVELSNEDDTLKVSINDDSCKGFCIFNKVSKIELYIPSSIIANINIDNKVGDTEIGNLPNAILLYKGNTGDLNIDSINEGSITNDVGDIRIEKINKGAIKANIGDVRINTGSNLEITNRTGDIKIENANTYIDITNTTGDVKITNLNITLSSKIKGDVGDIKIANTNDIYIEASTSVGDTKVNSKDRKSEIELTITNRIGDIKVNY